MGKLEFRVGPVYTFCFWGISRFLDVISWDLVGVIPKRRLDFNTFCGSPPLHLCIYEVLPSADGEKRHLQSRKQYYFHMLFWSSLKPPSKTKLRQILGEKIYDKCFGSSKNQEGKEQDKGKVKGNLGRRLAALLSCCVARMS